MCIEDMVQGQEIFGDFNIHTSHLHQISCPVALEYVTLLCPSMGDGCWEWF